MCVAKGMSIRGRKKYAQFFFRDLKPPFSFPFRWLYQTAVRLSAAGPRNSFPRRSTERVQHVLKVIFGA